jgi:hypothetical protein
MMPPLRYYCRLTIGRARRARFMLFGMASVDTSATSGEETT